MYGIKTCSVYKSGIEHLLFYLIKSVKIWAPAERNAKLPVQLKFNVFLLLWSFILLFRSQRHTFFRYVKRSQKTPVFLVPVPSRQAIKI